MSVDEALAFFTQHQETKIIKNPSPCRCGHGYVALGQSSSPLVGKPNESNWRAIYQRHTKESILFSLMNQQQDFISTILESCCNLSSTHRQRIPLSWLNTIHTLSNMLITIDLGPRRTWWRKTLASGSEDIAKKKSSLYKRLFANSLYQPK